MEDELSEAKCPLDKVIILNYHILMNNDNYQLPFHNPWWEDSFNIDHEPKLKALTELKFQFIHPFINEFPQDQDVVFTLRGPRRIGKTTLLKQLVKKLILADHVRRNIFYFPCDRVSDFNELYHLLQQFIFEKRAEGNDRIFLFIDEISFVKEWQRTIKALVDEGSLVNVTAILTGSNALDLIKSSERLPGRTGHWFKSDKLFLPLTFKDFFKLVNPEWDGKIPFALIPKIQKQFKDYLLCGGFPHVINEFYAKKNISSETYETFVKWIEGDIDHEDKSLSHAYAIFRELHIKLGSRLSFTEIAKNAGLASQATVQEYLEIFEKLFVVFKCDYFSLNEKKTDVKKNKKFYFTDPFIHNALIAKENGFLDNAFNYSKILLGEKFQDARFEEVIGGNLRGKFDKLYYGNFGSKNQEIDFVGFDHGKYDLFEVKRGRFKLAEFEKIISSLSGFEKLHIISHDFSANNKNVEVIPYYKFLI